MSGRNLRLEVNLQAVDKITGPLKSAMRGSRELSRAVKSARSELDQLNKRQSSMDGFKQLREQAKKSTEALRESQKAAKDLQLKVGFNKEAKENALARVKMAKAEYTAISKAIALTHEPTAKQATLQHQARAAMESAEKEKNKAINNYRNTQSKLKDENRRIKDLTERRGKLAAVIVEQRAALNSAGIKTHQLARHEEELKRNTDSATAALRKQEEQLKRVNKTQQQLIATRARYDKAIATRDTLAGAGVSTMAAGAVVGAPIAKMVRDYVSFEDAMLGVARQVEGARSADGKLTTVYYQMGDAIKAMAEKIPMATTEIAALVEGAARMGIQGKDNLLAFAKTAALASTAFDLPAEQISEDLGKIANIYKIPIKNIEQLGDVINYLDDNAQSKGADIINVMQRIAGSTGSMNYKEAAALGSTFLSLGASAEIAATATKAMVRELAIAEKQPKRFQRGLDELGLSAEKVQASMAKDSTGTIMKVLEAVKRLPEAKRMGVMVDLFGKEYGDDAAKLADNLGEYRKQLALVKAQGASGSMAREGDAKNDTLSAQALILQNKLFNQSSGLGSTLRQPLMEIMTAIGGITDKVTAWTKANPELTATMVKAAAVIAGMLVVSGGLMLAIAGIAGPFIVARFAIASFGIMLTSGIGIIGKAGSAFAMVYRSIGFLGGLARANPIAAIIIGIAGAIMHVVANWGQLMKLFKSGDWAGVGRFILQGLEAGLNAATLGLYGVIKRVAYGLLDVVKSIFGIHSPSRVFAGFGVNLMQGLANGIVAGLATVKSAITGAGASAIGWFKEKLGIHSPSRVFAQLGGYTMQGLAQGLNDGQASPLQAVMATAKKLTAAGAGLTLGAGVAMAGTLPIDNRPPLSQPGAAASQHAAAGPINITVNAAPGMDERALARLVAQEIDKAQRQQAARGRSRLTDRD